MTIENLEKYQAIIADIRGAIEEGSITNTMVADAFEVLRNALAKAADAETCDAISQDIPLPQSSVKATADDKRYIHSSGDENAADCVMSMRDTAIAVSGSNLVLRKGMWNPTTQTGQYKTTAVPTATTEHAGAMSAEDKAKLDSIEVGSDTPGFLPLSGILIFNVEIQQTGAGQITGVYWDSVNKRFLGKSSAGYHNTWLATAEFPAATEYNENADKVLFICEGTIYRLVDGEMTQLYAAQLSQKVDKVSGKGLSTNDFTDEYKARVEVLDTGDVNALVSVFSGNPNHPHDETDEYYGTGVIVWDNDSHVDNYYNKGVLRIKGERINPNDGLPIANYGSGHTLDGVLYVFDSSLANGGGASDDCCVMQLLVLSNRVGGQEGDMYMRSGSGSSQGSLTWKPWEKFQTNIEVGAVSSFDDFIDNGIYSGVYLPTYETFVMVVINNYAIASQAGQHKSVTQIKFANDLNGVFSFQTRIFYDDGGSGWSYWMNAGGSGEIIIQ